MKLELHAFVTNWERFKMRKRSKKFQSIRPKLITRDKQSCRYCGYRGPDLEIVNADHDYNNNKAENLITACSLCAKTQFLDAYDMAYSGTDKMIYLPELTQIQLHNLLRVLFCKTQAEGEPAYNAKMILAQLQNRADWLDKQSGSQLSHPAVFANYLSQPTVNNQVIQKIRWLPGVESYAPLIKDWRKVLEI